MTEYTHTSLTNELQRYIEDQDADFVATLDNIIALAERRLYLDLSLGNFDTDVSTSSIDNTEGSYLIPEESLEVHSVYDPVAKTYLLPRSESFVRMMRDTLPAATPEYWCRKANKQITFAPLFSSTTNDLTLTISVGPSHLTTINNETWLSKNLGDLLFAACLAQAERYNKNTEAEAVREGEYDALKNSYSALLVNSTRKKFTPMTANPETAKKPELKPGSAL